MEMSTKISAIENEVSSTDIDMLAKRRQKIISTTKETILEAQKRQKYMYDRKHAHCDGSVLSPGAPIRCGARITAV